MSVRNPIVVLGRVRSPCVISLRSLSITSRFMDPFSSAFLTSFHSHTHLHSLLATLSLVSFVCSKHSMLDGTPNTCFRLFYDFSYMVIPRKNLSDKIK